MSSAMKPFPSHSPAGSTDIEKIAEQESVNVLLTAIGNKDLTIRSAALKHSTAKKPHRNCITMTGPLRSNS